MRGLLVCLAMLPAAAQAQDITFSLDATLACLQEAVGLQEQRACVGASANACMAASPDGSTTYGMVECLGRESDYWDGRLNQSYQTVMARSAEIDAEMIKIGATVPSLAETLRTMQRAWIPFRDATCQYEMAQWTNGSGRGPAGVACMMQMTGEQTLLIEGTLY